MDLEQDYLYSKEHEWVYIDGNTALVGISEYATTQLGDITFVELPSKDDDVDQFDQVASVESVKAASDIYSPMSGKIIEVNTDLEEDPGIINKSPYEKGWIVKLEIADDDEKSNLMTADEYEKFLESVG